MTPSASFRSAASLAPSIGGKVLRSSATILANVSPAPWAAPVAAALVTIIDMLAQAKANTNAIRQLQDRCYKLVLVFQDNCNDASDIERCKGANAVTSTLEHVKQRMTRWASMSKVEQFLRQDDISSDIRQCHQDITDCLTNFQIISHHEIQTWQEEFEAMHKDDKKEIVQYLSDIKNQTTLTIALQREDSAKIDLLMEMMQKFLLPSTQVHDPSHGLESNLYHVQKSSQSLLPNLNLERGEVRRLGQYPVGGNGVMDIWEGMYLNEEKVAIKILRAVHCNPRSLK
ncbi:hypothetical protein BJ138DRAFT_1120539, partial [Hygrophoropsis aurantiaca]